MVDGCRPERSEGPVCSQSDPIVRRADSLVRAGRAWRATALLAAQLTTPTSASPEARLVGARAAAGWEGWTEVDRLLRGAPWIDQQFTGEAHELLARSALGRDADALPDARLAFTHAADEASRATRRVLLARAYDRAKTNDSAAAQYLTASQQLPRIADWLRLRAAGVTADSAARTALFARVAGATAKARVTVTDAQARERSGDVAGAARQFRRVGAEGSAFRVELLGARDDAARAELARKIVAFLSGTPAAGEARQSLEILDKLAPLNVRDELPVARAAAAAGVTARALTGFARAEAAAPLNAGDRMTYAGALARTGKTADALRIYASITDDSAIAPLAASQRARLLAQSTDRTAAMSALTAVATKFSKVRSAAAPALLLLADLQVDNNDFAGASRSLHDLVAAHPTSAQAPLALFRAGLIDWTEKPATAAAAFDSVATLRASSDEATAARYWAARAYERAGHSKEAADRWKAIIASAPLSYYAMLSAKRLHAAGWSAPGGADSGAHVPSVDSAVARIALLQRLGMDVEARFDVDALTERADRTPADAAAVTQALIAVDEPARALRVALAAIERGNTARSLYRAAYPILHDDALVEESRRNNLDPALVAGLIRQESSWNPRAVSPAGARGLMQLVPRVGAEIATSRRYPLWSPALLFDADVNLELGTAHLSSSLKRDTPPERALAAYNAGASRVTRWVQRPGTDDPELFTEWIPFTETRDYVRLVLRNAAVYRELYGMK
ncbi:MAG: hypothetical protein JWM95_1956 [Gemmatimonadetes bacterium]|nr:hypothetical protein [Gemmatimonadota bacterium]